MDNNGDQRPSPASCGGVVKCSRSRRRADENDGGDATAAAAASCTGKSCKSCTAGAIADCVAVCFCPCAVVNFLALALVKLPWAVARRFLEGRRRRRSLRRGSEMGRAGGGGIMSTSDDVLSGAVMTGVNNGELNDHFSAVEFKEDDVWLEVGHLGFGRVSFNGITYQDCRGN